jgi:hypothetical protein
VSYDDQVIMAQILDRPGQQTLVDNGIQFSGTSGWYVTCVEGFGVLNASILPVPMTS